MSIIPVDAYPAQGQLDTLCLVQHTHLSHLPVCTTCTSHETDRMVQGVIKSSPFMVCCKARWDF